MTSTFEAQKTVRGSYLLKEEAIRRIVKHLASSGGALKVSLKFENERTITSDNIDEILNDSLIRSTKIEELRLQTLTPPDTVAEVLFANGSGAMAYAIRGDRQWVLALEQDILSEFDSGRLWFSNLNPSRWPVRVNVNTAIQVFCLTTGLTLFLLFQFADWFFMPIPMKPPLCSEMIAPPDSGMISPP